MVRVSSSLTPELSPHLCLHHFPKFRQLQTHTETFNYETVGPPSHLLALVGNALHVCGTALLFNLVSFK